MSFIRGILFRPFVYAKKFPTLLGRHYTQSVLNISDPAVQNYLKHLLLEHDKLHMQSKRTIQESKRLQELKPIVSVLEERVFLFENIESLKELNKKENKDNEMMKMIKEEAQIYLKRLGDIDKDLNDVLMQPYLSEGGVLLEVSAGAGGQEAMLFARELFQMYESYASYKDWDVDIASLDKLPTGGIRKGSMLIEGLGVPELMTVEAGVHRVQRIPSTEKSGRIHTSTVSVAVLPQPTEIEFELSERDLVVETKRASGAGGQHVNTTDSAVRIVHVPTGTAVECQEGRSQLKNKDIALQKLRTLLKQRQSDEQTSKIHLQRKSQVGSGERNEKIRTYNYPQDRITEHRDGGGTMYNLTIFMEGGEQLEELQENLLRNFRYQTLLNEIEEFKKKYMIETEQ